MQIRLTLDEYKKMIGQEVGESDWFLIDQKRIDSFAELTGDNQFIHVDAVAAAATPFGGTVAHGFLVLSMLAAMASSATPSIEGAVMTINYGMNNLRFIRPVRAGKRVRARFRLLDLREKSPVQWQQIFNVTVEIEGDDRPSVVVEWIFLNFFEPVESPHKQD